MMLSCWVFGSKMEWWFGGEDSQEPRNWQLMEMKHSLGRRSTRKDANKRYPQEVKQLASEKWCLEAYFR